MVRTAASSLLISPPASRAYHSLEMQSEKCGLSDIRAYLECMTRSRCDAAMIFALGIVLIIKEVGHIYIYRYGASDTSGLVR